MTALLSRFRKNRAQARASITRSSISSTTGSLDHYGGQLDAAQPLPGGLPAAGGRVWLPSGERCDLPFRGQFAFLEWQCEQVLDPNTRRYGQFPATALIYRQGLVRTAARVVQVQLALTNLYALKGTPIPAPVNFDQLRGTNVPPGSTLTNVSVIDSLPLPLAGWPWIS